jgi:hypothetical protein
MSCASQKRILKISKKDNFSNAKLLIPYLFKRTASKQFFPKKTIHSISRETKTHRISANGISCPMPFLLVKSEKKNRIYTKTKRDSLTRLRRAADSFIV